MKFGNTGDVIHKEVVVIGNGPSGIVLSYMLSGNLPYLISDAHPDEMLSARLRQSVGQCLVQENLGELSAGLEGRSTNPISLLFDALQHPFADVGIEMEPLIEFRKAGIEIDHIVLGKGPPGGSWHKMDPYVLTLSLGSWMALPGLPFYSRDSGERRAYAHNVAKYYEQYVEQMNLSSHFHNNINVTSVQKFETQRLSFDPQQQWVKNHRLRSSCLEGIEDSIDEMNMEQHTCFISNAINRLLLKSNRKTKTNRCKRPRDDPVDRSPSRKIRELQITSKNDKEQSKSTLRRDTKRSISLSSCDSNNLLCDSGRIYKETSFSRYSLRSASSLDFINYTVGSKSTSVPYFSRSLSQTDYYSNSRCCSGNSPKWLIEANDCETGEKTMYSCNYLVLANGASDLPNKLQISFVGNSYNSNEPDWLVHDLRSLEIKLDNYLDTAEAVGSTLSRDQVVDPVLVVGAGLSAADAVVAVRGKNVPVLHVFRNKSADLNKQLPENMYPEYHKVHQMMKDGSSSYSNYSAFPEHTLTSLDVSNRSVILTSKSGEQVKISVSFVAVLIGSRPDLTFLPHSSTLGVNKQLPIDCKTNTVDINKLTHQIVGYENLFAVGPLAGDNFVRFLPGGALAVISELYARRSC